MECGFYLNRPAPLQPALNIASKDVSALSLMDLLCNEGYEERWGKCYHETTDTLKVFDERQAMSKMSYLRCLLCWGQLVSTGLTFLPSAQSNRYYDEILETGQDVDIKRPASAKKRKLALEDAPAMKALQNIAAPRPSPLNASNQRVQLQIANAPVPVASGSSSAHPGAAGIPGGGDVPVASGSGGDWDGPTGEDSGSDEDVRFRIEGQPVHVTKYYEYGRVTYQERWELKCQVHAHCRKSRSVVMDRLHFGDEGCKLYLQTWLKLGRTTMRNDPAKHFKYKPSVADITQFILERDLEEQQ